MRKQSRGSAPLLKETGAMTSAATANIQSTTGLVTETVLSDTGN